MGATAMTPRTRQGARHRLDQKHASERVVFCRTHLSASSLIRRRELHARVRGSRFLQVDPIEGGSANDYDYVNGDPINGLDLAGTAPVPYCDQLKPSDYKSHGANSGSIFTVNQQLGSHSIHWNFQVGASAMRDKMANVVTIDEVGRKRGARRLRDLNTGAKGYQNHGSATVSGNGIKPGKVYRINVVYVGSSGRDIVIGAASVTCRCR